MLLPVPSPWLHLSPGVLGVAVGVQRRLGRGLAVPPQVFLCKVCLWCKQEQAHVPEEPLQRACVCSKRGLCTWRGSRIGELGTIYCSHAWGLNRLCSHSPSVSVLTPALAPSRDIPISPGMALFGMAVWAWLPTLGTGGSCPPRCRGLKQFALAAAPWQVAPSLGPVPGTQRASADAGGRAVSAASTLARQFLTEPAPGPDTPQLPPCSIPPAGTRPYPARVHNISQKQPRSHGLGTAGNRPLSGTGSGRSGERRVQPIPGVHGETQVR